MEGKQQLVEDIGHLLHQRVLALKGQQEGLSAEAARVTEKTALLGRIKSFFGLAA